MRNTDRRTRENCTITVDFRNEATYFQLLGDGKAFLECILAFVMSLGFQLGRVPTTCGYCFETSPIPSASYESAGHKLSKPVLNPSSTPVSLYLSAPQRLHTMILNRYPVL